MSESPTDSIKLATDLIRQVKGLTALLEVFPVELLAKAYSGMKADKELTSCAELHKRWAGTFREIAADLENSLVRTERDIKDIKEHVHQTKQAIAVFNSPEFKAASENLAAFVLLLERLGTLRDSGTLRDVMECCRAA